MFKWIVSCIHGVRDTLMWISLSTLAFLNISPDSQGGFLHQAMRYLFETSERGHFVVSVASVTVFLASLSVACWRNRASFLNLTRKIWLDHKRNTK